MEKYNVLTTLKKRLSKKVAFNSYTPYCKNTVLEKVADSRIGFRSSLCNTSNLPNPPNLRNTNSSNYFIKGLMSKENQGVLEPLLMSYDDVQIYLGKISRSTVERMVGRKELPQPVALSPRRKMFITRDVKNMISSRIKGGKKNAK